MSIDASIREQFACLNTPVNGRPLVYLDSAATALKPECVIAAMTRYYRTMPANVHRGLHAMSEAATAAYEAAREQVRRFLNARSLTEIVFTSGTTDAINLVAGGFGGACLHGGDEVLITELEHHANIVPWQFLRDRHGIVLKVAPMTDRGELDMAAFERLLTDRTRLVALTAVSNALGTALPVTALTQQAHAAGALVLVDAAQAVACQRVDVQALDCDFLAFSGHKLFGPTGIGVLYGREALLERMQPFKGGGDMIRSVTFEKTTFNELPYKFEAGTPPIAGALGLHAAIDWVEAIGYAEIEAHEAALVASALDQLQALPGVRIIGTPAHRRSIVSFSLEGIHPHDAGTILDETGVAVRAGHHCAQPVMAHYGLPATLRAAFSVYNMPTDITALTDGIRHVQEVLT